MNPLMPMPGNSTYYTDGNNFYTVHRITNPRDGLWPFAAQDLGIFKAPKDFSQDEQARINDLAGGINTKTKYLLLKNGRAETMPYNNNIPNINPGDIILRKVDASTVPGLFRHSCGSYSLSNSVCSSCNKPFP